MPVAVRGIPLLTANHYSMEEHDMLSFASDYTEGAHPRVLKALTDSNLETLPGYGADGYSRRAKEKIAAECGVDADGVYFLVGGTQTNQVVISSLLGSYQGVVSAASGHINGHEGGAIEYSGHKVLPLSHTGGKLSADTVRGYMDAFYADASYEHLVFPGMVYISQPTEYGTLYSLSELKALSRVCRDFGLILYADGARLGYGLASKANDVSLRDMAEFCDVFYIGGTKVGALCGEAVVFTGKNAPAHFPTVIKQHGAMLAKGRLAGAQFDALFTDGLYYEVGRHGTEMGALVKAALLEKGYELYVDSPTNQQFAVMSEAQAEGLRKSVVFNVTERLDGGRVVARFVTSWASRSEDVAALRELL